MSAALPIFEHTDPSDLTKKDFTSDQEVRWCPGCGDYSILAQVQRTLPTLGVPREKHVVVGGIGCSSRFPYYMDTYGLHTIHGRAPAFATGIKTSRPELMVWVITGDGDGLSIGGNHLLHVLRRNVNLNILLFNNRIYGLTKGQYSPTSPEGIRTASTPVGSVDHPVDPLRFTLGAGATFVARVVDVDAKHFQEILKRAAAHEGTSFVEILQNCPIYNDGAFAQLADRKQRPEHALYLRHGEKLVFGPEKEHGLAMDETFQPKVVAADDPAVLSHDETSEAMAQFLSRCAANGLPTPLGVIRAVEKSTYETAVNAQIDEQREKRATTLQALLETGGTWTVE
ncbi:MAG: 2-oxoacid:ferredoxin oxidoreductase subunit beta [Myxococcota bacterium]